MKAAQAGMQAQAKRQKGAKSQSTRNPLAEMLDTAVDPFPPQAIVRPKRKPRVNPAVREYILDNVEKHPRDITATTADALGITRVSVRRYINALIGEGLLDAAGKTKTRRYELHDFVKSAIPLEINDNFEEHIVWRNHVAPLLKDIPKNILEMCEHGISEMLNNVKDHSGSKRATVVVTQSARFVQIIIEDYGIGIFKKIADSCGLNDPRESILELSKGKLTTDPARHTGEGIFFTSRMFTEFSLTANNLWFSHIMQEDDDWLMEAGYSSENVVGTTVFLKMSLKETHNITDIFKKYEQNEDGYLRFSKTHVPVRLALYDNEQLVSRSQARRVLARFNRFSEVILDFLDVPIIGQAFADEIFRVYRNEHPEVRLLPVRAAKPVYNMIKRVAPETVIAES